jgi:hypothetical protein
MKKSTENIDVLHGRASQIAAAVERLSFMTHASVVDSNYRPVSVEGPVTTGFTNVDFEANTARQIPAWQLDFSVRTKMSL